MDYDQIELWNQAADSKGFHHPLNLPMFNRQVDGDKLVVDLGCGWGRVLDLLAEEGYRNIVGFDPSPVMVERGNRESPELDIRLWQENQIPLDDGSAGAVLLFAVLTCIPDDSAQMKLIAEAYRLLEPGGVLYISDYFLQTDRRNLKRYDRYETVYGKRGVFEIESGLILRHMSIEWFNGLVSQFLEIGHYEMELMTMNGNPARAFQYLGHRRG